MGDARDFKALARRIGYRFRDEKLLHMAFMHTSFVNEHPDMGFESNQRLEYLGDAVVELTVTNELYFLLPEASEGRLSSIRAKLVCTEALSYAAGQLGLADCLMMGKGADKTGERENPSVLEDAFEALAGAVYLDGGFKKASRFVKKALEVQIRNAVDGRGGLEGNGDYKTALQIALQKNGAADIRYELQMDEGPPHDRVFYMDVLHEGEVVGSGFGRSKKDAEQMAAKRALRAIESRNKV
jgi:ribonuclease-3